MPQTKSAKKALKQNQKRRLTNLSILRKLQAVITKFRKAPTVAGFIKVQSSIDITVKKKVISKNKAARLKSRLAKMYPTTQKPKLKPKQGLTKKTSTSSLKKTRS